MVRMESRDLLMLGEILLKTALRKSMYTQGSRIWLNVAKRSHNSRYLICSGPPDSTVLTTKTWKWMKKDKESNGNQEQMENGGGKELIIE